MTVIAVRPDQPALTQIHEHRRVVKAHKDHAQQVIDLLANMRFLDLEPNRMREAAFPGQTRLGDGGENLPTVLRKICADPQRKATLAEWTRELTPMDVRNFDFPVDQTTQAVGGRSRWPNRCHQAQVPGGLRRLGTAYRSNYRSPVIDTARRCMACGAGRDLGRPRVIASVRIDRDFLFLAAPRGIGEGLADVVKRKCVRNTTFLRTGRD